MAPRSVAPANAGQRHARTMSIPYAEPDRGICRSVPWLRRSSAGSVAQQNGVWPFAASRYASAVDVNAFAATARLASAPPWSRRSDRARRARRATTASASRGCPRRATLRACQHAHATGLAVALLGGRPQVRVLSGPIRRPAAKGCDLGTCGQADALYLDRESPPSPFVNRFRWTAVGRSGKAQVGSPIRDTAALLSAEPALRSRALRCVGM
jgi:hypothetical protein